MWLCTGTPYAAASLPKPCSSSGVQEGTKRGVITGSRRSLPRALHRGQVLLRWISLDLVDYRKDSAAAKDVLDSLDEGLSVCKVFLAAGSVVLRRVSVHADLSDEPSLTRLETGACHRASL